MAGSALVIGAGVAGLATAVGLRRDGWHVEICERGPRVETGGAAFGMWPAAQRGLAELGVAPRLQAGSVPYRTAAVRSVRGQHLADLPLQRIERTEGRPVVLVLRQVLMEALLDTLADLGGGPVRVGTTPALDRAALERFDLVVGADGIRSAVRPLVDADALPPRALGATAWRGVCDGVEEAYGEVWGAGMFTGVTPGGPGRTNWYVAVSHRRCPPDFERLGAAVHGWPSPVPEVLSRTCPADVLRHDIWDLPPPRRYARDRAALVGDAAHAMAPSLGQGACQAVLDAVALVDCLAGFPDVPAALRAYDRARRPTGTRFVRASRLLLRLQLAERGASARDLTARALRPLAR
jgi:2-polyprenyl-6-methoxyphenol hydroxylase-like FAD-dependent oxidoreductase